MKFFSCDRWSNTNLTFHPSFSTNNKLITPPFLVLRNDVLQPLRLAERCLDRGVQPQCPAARCLLWAIYFCQSQTPFTCIQTILQFYRLEIMEQVNLSSFRSTWKRSRIDLKLFSVFLRSIHMTVQTDNSFYSFNFFRNFSNLSSKICCQLTKEQF